MIDELLRGGAGLGWGNTFEGWGGVGVAPEINSAVLRDVSAG